MALTLIELFEKQSEATLRNMVTAACWKHAKTLIARPTPSVQEMTQAVELLSQTAIPKYVIAVAVIIDDGTLDDAAVESAVITAAGKFLVLIP